MNNIRDAQVTGLVPPGDSVKHLHTVTNSSQNTSFTFTLAYLGCSASPRDTLPGRVRAVERVCQYQLLKHVMCFMGQERLCKSACILTVRSLTVDFFCALKCLGNCTPIFVPYKWEGRMCLLENPRTGTKKFLDQMNVKGRF